MIITTMKNMEKSLPRLAFMTEKTRIIFIGGCFISLANICCESIVAFFPQTR